MDCQQFYKHLWGYADHNIPKSLEKTLDKHCLECEDCARAYRLTVIENSVLQNKSDIPDLAEDFTAKIMNTVYQNHNQDKSISLNNWKHFVKKVSAITAPLMVVACLLLVFYFYGIPINSDNTQLADVNTESPQEDFTGSNTPEDEKIIPDAGDAAEIKVANNARSAPVDSFDKTDSFQQNSEPEPSAVSDYNNVSPTDEPNKPEPSRSTNSTLLPPDFSDYPLPVNLPEKYTLSQTINTNEQNLIMIYGIAATEENFSLQISKIDDLSPESPISTESASTQDIDSTSKLPINPSSDLPDDDKNINNNDINAYEESNPVNTSSGTGAASSLTDDNLSAVTAPNTAEDAKENLKMKDKEYAEAEITFTKEPSTEETAPTNKNTNDIQWEIVRNQTRYQITVSGSVNLSSSQLQQISEEIKQSL
jgi:hypothetical protein